MRMDTHAAAISVDRRLHARIELGDVLLKEKLNMKGMIRWIALIALLVTGLTGSAAASTNGSITGTVVDQQEQALPGVVVTIELVTAGYYANKVTGTNGAFSVGNLKAATYTLTLTSPGFATLKKDILVPLGKNVQQTFVMTASQ